jgi:hypothetical protein
MLLPSCFARGGSCSARDLALRRSPGTLLNVGNCLELEGQLVAALDVFVEVRALAASEPDARKSELWTSAADEEIAAVEARIPRLTVIAAAPAPRVTLDGQPIAVLGEPLRVNPGRRRIEATADGRQPFERELELAEGQSQTVEIPELAMVAPAPVLAPPLPQVEPAASSAPPAQLDRAPPADAASSSEAAPSVWPWAVIGVGAALFVGGAATGIVAADMKSDLAATCPMMECAGNLAPVDRAHRTAIAADVLMLSGVVTAGVGTAWLLLSDDDGSSPVVAAGCGKAGCEAQVSGQF